MLERGPIFRYADPFGALNLAVMGAGDQLQWHFDQTDFVVSLAIQSAESGRRLRGGAAHQEPQHDESTTGSLRVLAGDRSKESRTLPMTPGNPSHLRGSPLAAPGQSRRREPPWRRVGLLAYDI